MIEPIERVAKVIFDAVGCHWSVALHVARLAIEEIREPTEAMLAAAEPRYLTHAHGCEPDERGPGDIDIWRSMVDAALKETANV